MIWSIWYCSYVIVCMIWTISYGVSNMEPCFETMSIWISFCLYYKNSNSDFYKFLWFFWFVMFSTLQWWGMKKCIWSRVPEIFPLPKLMDRDFLYIYSSLKVKNLYKFLIGSTTYWKIQYFFVWHCLPVCWSVGCAVRYIGVRRVYWSWIFMNTMHRICRDSLRQNSGHSVKQKIRPTIDLGYLCFLYCLK